MKRFVILASIVAFLCSCSIHKSVYLNSEDKSYNIREYSNYLLFQHKSKTVLSKDKERFWPISFEIQLPKRVKSWEAINSTNFGFYYRHNQVVFISTNPFYAKEPTIDSVFIPSKKEIEKMVDNFETSGHKKWDIKKIGVIKNRKNIVMRKDNTTILLLNIRNNDFEAYYRLVRSYRRIQ